MKTGFVINTGEVWEIKWTHQTKDHFFQGDYKFKKRSKIFNTIEDAKAVIEKSRSEKK